MTNTGRLRNDVNWPAGVIFDFDGLLVDSAACWHRAYHDTAEQNGLVLDAKLLATLSGASVQTAAARTGLPAGDLRRNLFRAFADNPPSWLPGARELIGALGGHIRLAVATNAPRDLVSTALWETCLNGSFEAVISAEEQAEGKPAPDVYVAACLALGTLPSQAVAFEDSPVGIIAAQRAGMKAVQVSLDDQTEPGVILHVPRLDDPRVPELLGLHALN